MITDHLRPPRPGAANVCGLNIGGRRKGGGRERQSIINDLNVSVGSEPLNQGKVQCCIINKVWVDTVQFWC